MASFWYGYGLRCAIGADWADSDADRFLFMDQTNYPIKIGLYTDGGTYTPNVGDTYADVGGTADFTGNELDTGGYTKGYGGAGRKDLADANKAFSYAASTVTFDYTTYITWASLATGTTIGGAVIMHEKKAAPSDDTAVLLLVHCDFTAVPTNGGNFTIDFDALGIGYITIV